jgi:hypothetical protein
MTEHDSQENNLISSGFSREANLSLVPCFLAAHLDPLPATGERRIRTQTWRTNQHARSSRARLEKFASPFLKERGLR